MVLFNRCLIVVIDSIQAKIYFCYILILLFDIYITMVNSLLVVLKGFFPFCCGSQYQPCHYFHKKKLDLINDGVFFCFFLEKHFFVCVLSVIICGSAWMQYCVG